MAIHVHVRSTPLRTRMQIDEWTDVVVKMRDGRGVTRYVGVEGTPDVDVVFLREELVGCLRVMDEIFCAKEIPQAVQSVMELRGVFGDEARSALSYMTQHREAFRETLEINLLEIDNANNEGVLDVYEVIIDGLQAICDHGEEGIMVFD